MPDPIQLLVVDDEELNRTLLRRILESEYDISEAVDAEQAIGILERDSGIRLVLCDQLMPGRTGVEMASIVHTRWPKLRVLLLTGAQDDGEIQHALEVGTIAAVLVKPWRAKHLFSLITQYLS